MADENGQVVTIALPGEWALKKIFGPTLETLGQDFNSVYKKGRDKIVAVAQRKITNLDDSAIANLRVSRDVFWNGSFTDDSICAEYFGGILAASRSKDGKDDSAIYYVDLIKSLSSAQLRLHYMIYRTLNLLLCSDSSKSGLNVGQSTSLSNIRIHFSTVELQIAELKIDTDLEALYRKGLLNEYRIDGYNFEKEMVLPYTLASPTVLGVQLFAIANNDFDSWREFNTKDFGDFSDIKLPRFYAFSLVELLKNAGIK